MMPRLFRTAVLVVTPCVWLVLWCVARDAGGPFWIERDPEYTYLLDSLQVATGHSAGAHLLVHPGATLQVWCAAVTHLVGWLRGADSVAHDVVRNPELYLAAQLTALMGLYALILYLAGVVVQRATRSTLAALAVQLAPLTLLPLTLCARKLYCEPMVMLLGMALICALFAYLPRPSPRQAWGAAIVCALVCGSGIATKFIFAPLLLVPLIVLPGIRVRLFFVVASLAIAVAWTAPVLWPHYGQMLQICRYNISHTEQYGKGAAGIGDITGILARMRAMLAGFALYGPALAATAVIAGVLSICAAWRGRTPSEGQRARQPLPWRALRMVWALLLTQAVMLFIVARRNTLLYYIPATQLYGATLVACAYALVQVVAAPRAAGPRRRWLRATLRTLAYAMPCAVMVCGMLAQRTAVRRELAALQRNRQALEAHLRDVAPRMAGATCMHLWSLTPVDALQFGNDNSDWRCGDVLQEVHPDEVFYDPRRPAGNQFHHFGRDVSVHELAQRHTNLYYRTSVLGYWQNALPPLPLTPVLSGAGENIYRVAVAALATNTGGARTD
jgi:hypothetical protein